jgi:hypothetical protein
MPVTSVNIPNGLLKYIDSLVKQGVVKSRKDVVLKALENYRRFSMHEWQEPRIRIFGVRGTFLTLRSFNELVKELTGEQLYEVGRRMGRALKELCLTNFNSDITKRENWNVAFQVLRDICGIGSFKVSDNKIIVHNPFYPIPLLHGYLETALDVRLKRVETLEDVAIYELAA